MLKKILVAMSGGVDSSVTALLLKEQGYECCGCTMKLYDAGDVIRDAEETGDTAYHTDEAAKTCCSLSDIDDARSVARRLGMNYHVLNYKDDFEDCVIRPFVESYERAETPNPCIECNRHLKFAKLLQQAEVLGFDGIATGHYARIEYENGRYLLKKALDPSKDQSYVLYSLTQEQLAKILFPLGTLTKTEARAIAERAGLVNAHKHDSQDICFVPDGDYAGLIERYTGKTPEPGNFVTTDGKILGNHKGLIHYTIGQRKGLGIAAEAPLYVVRLDTASNSVVLGSNDDLFSKVAHVKHFHYIAGDELTSEYSGLRCSAKIRYRHTEQPCTVTYDGYSAEDGHMITITFDEPQRAITPGQTAVLYDGDTVLGGGVIKGMI